MSVALAQNWVGMRSLLCVLKKNTKEKSHNENCKKLFQLISGIKTESFFDNGRQENKSLLAIPPETERKTTVTFLQFRVISMLIFLSIRPHSTQFLAH